MRPPAGAPFRLTGVVVARGRDRALHLLAAGGGWDDALLEVTPVDLRDVTWDVDHPTYRVYFWRHGMTVDHAG
jgi:hypothetical protein